MRLSAILLAVAVVSACAKDPASPPVTVHVPAGLPQPIQSAAADLVADLGKMGAKVTQTDKAAPACKPGEIDITVAGISQTPPLKPQGYEIAETKCGTTSRVLTLRGGSLLSAQWVVYDLLDRLGVRYFHPEQTLYPTKVAWPDTVATRAAPAFQMRSIHAHTTHPIELSVPKDTTGVDMTGIMRRWVDWNIKQRQTDVDGLDGRFVGTYAFDRGYPRGAGLNLVESQQGGVPLLDPAHPEEDATRIATAIDQQMKHVDGIPDVSSFGFSFNPSEFTTSPTDVTINRINTVTNYMTQHYPGIPVQTINHGTHQEPLPDAGVRFFDLSQFAPPELTVSVHGLMFYDLERPAPVYGNESFQFLLDFIRTQAKVRRIIHYPESSWWLTFDEPVPLYLAPVSIEARQHDIDLLRDLVTSDPDAKTGVYGHHVFSSGQEWGYWLADWCHARMSWDLAYTKDRCLDDFTGSLAQSATLRQVLAQVEHRQVGDMRNPELIRFLVGSDDATEAALAAGIPFHPLPPQPKDVLAWNDIQAAAMEANSLQPLRAMAADYHQWAATVDGTLSAQSAAQAPFVREIRDGIEMFALRAEHAVAVYDTALKLRKALKAADLSQVQAAAAGVEVAKSVTERARAVVESREKDYRYPAALTIAGDEAGTSGAIPNDTIYPYRYLSRTHRLFYWTRPDSELEALFGDSSAVQVPKRIFRRELPLQVSLLKPDISNLLVSWGDGTQATSLDAHTYATQGLFDWHLTAQTATGLVDHADQAAPVERRIFFPLHSLQVASPAGASILTGLLPGFEVGLGDDGSPFLVLGRVDDASGVATAGTLQRFARTGMATTAGDVTLTLNKVGTVTLHQAVISIGEGSGPTGRTFSVAGDLLTNDVVALLVQVGGFDEPGARHIIAEILEVDPLPESIPFEVTATGTETDD